MIYSNLIIYITRGVKMTDLALILIVSVVGTLITVYACGYMKDYHKHHTEFADRRRKNTCK
jgi:NADH:ubiquinone oxidoreductase subunit 5 (subunit L)/multisubunit Na+/H+ antiporter MnhA subunit